MFNENLDHLLIGLLQYFKVCKHLIDLSLNQHPVACRPLPAYQPAELTGAAFFESTIAIGWVLLLLTVESNS